MRWRDGGEGGGEDELGLQRRAMFDPAAIVAYFEQNPLHIVLLCFLLYRCVPCQQLAQGLR